MNYKDVFLIRGGRGLFNVVAQHNKMKLSAAARSCGCGMTDGLQRSSVHRRKQTLSSNVLRSRPLLYVQSVVEVHNVREQSRCDSLLRFSVEAALDFQ